MVRWEAWEGVLRGTTAGGRLVRSSLRARFFFPFLRPVVVRACTGILLNLSMNLVKHWW
jgi:hypothetical protein